LLLSAVLAGDIDRQRRPPGVQQQQQLRRSTALSGEREQCHVVSRRRKLKTDSLLLEPVARQLTRSLLFAGFACSSKLDFDTEPV